MRHVFGRAMSAAVVVGSLVVLGGSGAGAAAPAAKPVQGGAITYAHNFEPSSWDPAKVTGANTSAGDTQYSYAVFDVLMYENFNTGNVTMRLAKSLTSTDSVVWTLVLRPGVKFSDGTDYDATAVKFNWERMADAANASPNRATAAAIQSLDVVDPLTLKITLKAGNGQFPRAVSKGIPFIGSPTALRADAVKFGLTSPVGAGPFVVKTFTRGSSTQLERNPNYWDKPRPYLDQLNFLFVPDDSQRYNTFIGGQAQMELMHRGYAQIEQAKNAGIKVLEAAPSSEQTNWLFNMKKLPFSDPIARQAVNYAVNRQLLASTVGLNVVSPAATMFASSSPFYDKSLKLPQYDKPKAQQLFDQYAAAHGGPMEFTMVTVAGGSAALVTFIQAQLAEFKNVVVKTDIVAAASTILSIYAAGNFGLAAFSYTAVDPEPDLANFLGTGGSRNFMGYSNPAVDAAFQTGRTSLKQADRQAAYKTVQQEFLKDLPMIYLLSAQQHTAVDKAVKGVRFAVDNVPLWSYLWLGKAKK